MLMMLNVEVEFLLMHFDFQYLESIVKINRNTNLWKNDLLLSLTIGGDNCDRHFSIVCRSLSYSAAAAKSTGSVVG